MTAEAASAPPGRTYRPPTQRVIYAILFAIVAVFVLYPIATIVVNSFITGQIGKPQDWGLDGWRTAVSDPTMLSALGNTLKILAANELISFPVAIFFAWLLARTDLPGRSIFEFMFWIGFFMPALSVTLGWIILLDPHNGIVNQLLRKYFAVRTSPFNIYSFWGIIWAHLSTASISVKVMLLTPAFRNVDSSLEEAARTVGANRTITALRITIPLVTPAILTVLALSLIRALQTFEIEMVLGPPFRFWVYGTKVYTLVAQDPPNFQAATALATMGFGVIIPLILAHRWLISRKDYGSITGRIKSNPVRLGGWRYPAVALTVTTVFVLTILPVIFLVMSSFMSLFGYFDIDDAWTLDHWRTVLNNDYFLQSIGNTLIMAAGSAVGSVLFCALIAHYVVRSTYKGRGVLDFVSWMTFAIPGILFGIGMLYVVLGTPFLRGLYGTLGILVLAAIVGHMTFGIQVLKTAMLQLGAELEEAARTTGATWWQTFSKIVVPILVPSLILVGTMNFISAARDISEVALLATNATRTLSLLQMDHMIDGRWESAAVISVIVVTLTIGVGILVRLWGSRFGLRT